MSANETKQEAKKTSASTEDAKAAAQAVDSVQAAFDEANAKGYFGVVPGEDQEAAKDGK